MAARPALGRGVRVLRSTPWLPVAASSAAGGGLLCSAALSPTTAFAYVAVVIGLATCGGSAAYLLDEESAVVLDATPTSRGLRTRWRLLLLVVPGGVALAGLAVLDRADGSGQWDWLHLAPLACGSLAAGTAIAAALRRRTGTPGDVAAAGTLAGFLLVVAANPLRHWASTIPRDDTDAGRSGLLWACVVLVSTAVVLRSSRDPVRR